VFKFFQKKYLVIFLSIFLINHNASANFSLIRDAQTEKFLREISNPIFKAANLNEQNIRIFIVNDSTLNAFVAGGQNIFIHTGLIRKFNKPDALIGVIAHEVGHIAGGHLARNSEISEGANAAMILSYLLGIGAAAAGSPDASAALILGGGQTAQRIYLRYTRHQEEAADQYAIKYLSEIQYPADGLINLLEYFDSQMIGYKGQIDEYLLSHPLSKKRINLIKNRASKEFSDKKINAKFQPEMNFILAKLEGFIDDPNKVLEKYQNKTDIFSNYKKAIAFYKIGKIKEAISLIDDIISEEINQERKGFLYELVGQIYHESGDIFNAILAYKKAIKLIDFNYAVLAKISFCDSILALKNNDEELLKLALKYLMEAELVEKENPRIFKLKAEIFDKLNEEGKSFLALANYNCLINNKAKCAKYAKKAQKIFKEEDVIDGLKAKDLIKFSKSADGKFFKKDGEEENENEEEKNEDKEDENVKSKSKKSKVK
jgi:predicted Zn-dependent protease